jgi:hypothetical protein
MTSATRFEEAMEDDFREAVERLTGQEGAGVHRRQHIDPDVAAEAFILNGRYGRRQGGLPERRDGPASVVRDQSEYDCRYVERLRPGRLNRPPAPRLDPTNSRRIGASNWSRRAPAEPAGHRSRGMPNASGRRRKPVTRTAPSAEDRRWRGASRRNPRPECEWAPMHGAVVMRTVDRVT